MSGTEARITLQKSRFILIQQAADFDEGVSRVTRQLVNTRLDMLEHNWGKFQDEHESMCLAMSEQPLNSLINHDYIKMRTYERCHAFYVYARAKLLTLRDELDTTDRQSRSGLSDSGATTSLMPRSALPRISLPNFSGDYKSWRPFHDLFAAIIRDNSELSSVEKMHYLKTCLTGEAAQLVSNLPVAGDNFIVAWNLLVSRYENKRFLINAQLDRLANLKPLKIKSAQGLNAILTTISEALGALRALGCAVHHWDPILLHRLVSLLDLDTREAWEIKLGSSTAYPTYAQFEEFLIARTRAIENINLHPSIPTPQKERQISFPGKNRLKVAAYVATAPSTLEPPKCQLCNSSHYLLNCDRYQSKSPQQRREILLKQRRCFNCLRAHTVNKCNSTRRCLKCGKRHHTSIHDAINGNPARGLTDGKGRLAPTRTLDQPQTRSPSD